MKQRLIREKVCILSLRVCKFIATEKVWFIIRVNHQNTNVRVRPTLKTLQKFNIENSSNRLLPLTYFPWKQQNKLISFLGIRIKFRRRQLRSSRDKLTISLLELDLEHKQIEPKLVWFCGFSYANRQIMNANSLWTVIRWW